MVIEDLRLGHISKSLISLMVSLSATIYYGTTSLLP